jgi:hypothetical protein
MQLTTQLLRETDGRWIGDIPELPGVTVYGATPKETKRKAKSLALRVMGAAVFRPSRKSNPALATDLEPVYMRLPPGFGAIRATAEHHPTSSPWPPKSAIVESVGPFGRLVSGHNLEICSHDNVTLQGHFGHLEPLRPSKNQ